ncbi:MAG: M48 family metalloprotease [Bryobacteraceae bacterium]|nr:M48 family metalloprotease [Bryobacteraceae bacterium]
MELCRPLPVSAEERSELVRTLPREGNLDVLSRERLQKLARLAAVLRVHQRETAYLIRVIDVPQAWTGLFGRTVLLISAPALDLLTAEELQALAAHEAGHEYYAGEFEHARASGDAAALASIEAACDRIAVLTLQELRIAPSRLSDALLKVQRFNRLRFGRAWNEGYYPALEERRRSIAEFSRRSLSPPPPPHVPR